MTAAPRNLPRPIAPRSRVALRVAALVGIMTAGCGGGTQMLLPEKMEPISERLPVQQLGAGGGDFQVGPYRVVIEEKAATPPTELHWTVSVIEGQQELILDCQAQYQGAAGAGPDNQGGQLSCQSTAGRQLRLTLAGPRRSRPSGRLTMGEASYTVDAVYEVTGGPPPAVPAGYSVRRAFKAVAASETPAADDPGAVYLSEQLQAAQRPALTGACLALMQFDAWAP